MEISNQLYNYLKELVENQVTTIDLDKLEELKPILCTNVITGAVLTLHELELNRNHLKGEVWEIKGEKLLTEDIF